MKHKQTDSDSTFPSLLNSVASEQQQLSGCWFQSGALSVSIFSQPDETSGGENWMSLESEEGFGGKEDLILLMTCFFFPLTQFASFKLTLSKYEEETLF